MGGEKVRRVRPTIESLEVRRLLAASPASPAVLASFPGLTDRDNAEKYPVPDVIAAAGPNEVVEAVNATVRIFDKATGDAVSTKSFADFFAPLGNVLSFVDPVAAYDEDASHFYLGITEYNPTGMESRFDFAASLTSDPTGPWEMHRLNLNEPGAPQADFPRLGWNADTIVVTFNQFVDEQTFSHVQLLTMDKASATDGNNATFTSFQSDLPGGDKRSTVTPAAMHGAAAGGPAYLLEAPQGGGASLNFIRMTNALSAAPTLVETPVPVTRFRPPPAAL